MNSINNCEILGVCGMRGFVAIIVLNHLDKTHFGQAFVKFFGENFSVASMQTTSLSFFFVHLGSCLKKSRRKVVWGAVKSFLWLRRFHLCFW